MLITHRSAGQACCSPRASALEAGPRQAWRCSRPRSTTRLITRSLAQPGGSSPSVGPAPSTTEGVSPPASAARKPKKVVIVGGGWAGFGAAKHLTEQGFDVTVLDASPNPGGLSTGWRTPRGRAVEAGFKGFWYEYENIFALVRELGIEWPFTPFLTSGFWSPKGLTTEAPVFSEKPRLPTMLGQFVWTAQLEWKIPLQDRLTMFNLALPVIDALSDPEAYARYDAMSAHDLFRSWGISKKVYDDFLKPTCLIGLFAPPEELSAAVVLSTFWFYALAHQASFDVCWCKGSVAERIFEPLTARIRGAGGRILGSHLVTDVEVDSATGRVAGVKARDMATLTDTYHEADAVVFSVGITGMQKIVTNSSALGDLPEFRAVMNLQGTDVIATRMWFDKKVACRFPANVLGGFEDNAGATFFDLNALTDEYRDEPGSVIAADYYHAGALLPLSDDEVVRRTHEHIIACEPGFRDAKVVDSAVLRFPKAVTQFSPGSYRNRPFQRTSISNMFIAGDWVKGVPHGANGLSQERAYVTGLLAANMVVNATGQGSDVQVLQTEANEPFVEALIGVNRAAKGALRQLGIESPFV